MVIDYIATNLREECDPIECLTCPYFDVNTKHCSADEKIWGCKYCKNAFTDLRLDRRHDLQYIQIGKAENGTVAFMRSSAEYKPPVSIVVQQYREDIQQNVDIAIITPKYCPFCGRKIIENKQFWKD